MINTIPKDYPSLIGIPNGEYEERLDFFENKYGFRPGKMTDEELDNKLLEKGFKKLEDEYYIKDLTCRERNQLIETLSSHLKENQCEECKKNILKIIEELRCYKEEFDGPLLHSI